MDLGLYKLHADYAELFLTTTKNSEESIFLLPRSIEYKVTLGNWTVMNEVSRNPGGWGAFAPSWDLLAAYECIDGLPIDESPLLILKTHLKIVIRVVRRRLLNLEPGIWDLIIIRIRMQWR